MEQNQDDDYCQCGGIINTFEDEDKVTVRECEKCHERWELNQDE